MRSSRGLWCALALLLLASCDKCAVSTPTTCTVCDAGEPGRAGCTAAGIEIEVGEQSATVCVSHDQVQLEAHQSVVGVSVHALDPEGNVVARVEVPDLSAVDGKVAVLCRKDQVPEVVLYDRCESAEIVFVDRLEDIIGFDRADIATKRAQMRSAIFGTAELPDAPPEVVDSDESAFELSNLARSETVTFMMANGVPSVVELLWPEDGGERLAIYHQGHRGSPTRGTPMVQALLDDGWVVAAMAMPLRGPNEVPEYSIAHSNLFRLHDFGSEGMRYFMEPLARTIAYARAQDVTGDVVATGISGGGWTIQLYAALDPRVVAIAPVAGSAPLFARRFALDDWGDNEQNNPATYSRLNYLAVYAMAAHQRRALIVQNLADTCCFAGRAAEVWAFEANAWLAGDGDVRALIDDTHEGHAISPFARDEIVTFLSP